MIKPYLILLLIQLTAEQAFTQAGGGIEQYHYVSASNSYLYVPVVHLQNKKQWYAEARYNYEDLNTFSLHIGKTFQNDNRFSYSFTPLLGAVAGNFNGVSAGVNMELSYDNVFFSTQSQYSFSKDARINNFLYNWSEMGYQCLRWLDAGISAQHTQSLSTGSLLEPGVFVRLSYKQYTVPLYAFNPLYRNNYFVIGLSYEWQRSKPRSTPVVANTTLNE